MKNDDLEKLKYQHALPICQIFQLDSSKDEYIAEIQEMLETHKSYIASSTSPETIGYVEGYEAIVKSLSNFKALGQLKLKLSSLNTPLSDEKDRNILEGQALEVFPSKLFLLINQPFLTDEGAPQVSLRRAEDNNP